jgi:zinc/manganese transport system ATP-binding protein
VARPDSAVHFTDATARLGGRDIWAHVDLTVDAGAFVAVLGPNGSGKSTLINVVLGLLPLGEGRVEVLGRPPGEAGGDIGYLPQRRSFDPSMRVRGIDVVRLGFDGDRWGVPLPWGAARRARDARVEEVIDLVGATAYASRPIGEVSGGEQQRLLIAQALVRKPRLLLLDEPLDSLDLPSQGAVAALIAEISQQFGITVLIVAHDVNPIASALDGVVYVARGRVVSGSPEEVITTETLSDLYGIPIEVLTTSDGRRVVVGQPDASSHHAGHHGPHEHGPHAGHEHTPDRY